MKEYRTRADGTIVEYNEADLAAEKRKHEEETKGCLKFVGGAIFVVFCLAGGWLGISIGVVIAIVWILVKCPTIDTDEDNQGEEAEAESEEGEDIPAETCSSRSRKKLPPKTSPKQSAKSKKRSSSKQQSTAKSSLRKRDSAKSS